MDFFTHEILTPTLARIKDVTGVYAYLAVGTERAALVDAGTGIGDLAAYVRGLTAKPLALLVTHGHMDHAGGASRFGEAFLAEEDRALAAAHGTRAMIEGYARTILRGAADGIGDADYPPAAPVDWKPWRHGDVLDLGGVSVEAVRVPGHTQGMTCALFREDRMLLYGDACNPFVFLFGEESSTVAEYRTSLVALRAYGDRYDRALMSHGAELFDADLLESCLAVCDDILAGRTDDVPFPFMGRLNPIAKAVTTEGGWFRRADGGLGNIVYDRARIR